MVSNTNEKASWNLSQLLIMEIGNLLRSSSDYYVKGNYVKSYDTLKAVSMRFISYLTQEEYNALVELEKPLSSYSRALRFKIGFMRPKFGFNIEVKLQEKLDEYNKLIFSYLKKYGLLIPAKRDATEMDA